MKIQIRGRNIELSELLTSHVERRLGFALSRFGPLVGDVVVRFSEAGGHRSNAGPFAKRCQMNIGLRRSLRVEDTDIDPFVAVDRAADRASRCVARALERDRDWHRGPTSPPLGETSNE